MNLICQSRVPLYAVNPFFNSKNPQMARIFPFQENDIDLKMLAVSGGGHAVQPANGITER